LASISVSFRYSLVEVGVGSSREISVDRPLGADGFRLPQETFINARDALSGLNNAQPRGSETRDSSAHRIGEGEKILNGLPL
jgi:hypothetical protein